MKYRISVAHFTSLLSNFINKPALSNKHNNAEPYIIYLMLHLMEYLELN